ncbi:MAG TPA: GNAT family N-acetyltransferase [Chthoniobacteraceae bacterium]|nr:GNAT family N-acetyltransferase [Chthoniobacteraceae bacterium]
MAFGQPTLQTERLALRPLVLEDARALTALAGAPEIAATTLRIPHPYPRAEARRFIKTQESLFLSDRGATFAIEDGTTGELYGCVGFGCENEHRRAELGYWIGLPYWGRGYATEAARKIVAYGFAIWKLHRITAHHFVSNPASGRVLEKLGMKREGLLREHFYKPGQGFRDAYLYGLLVRDWTMQQLQHPAYRHAEP